jgi:glycerol kinase
MAEVLGLPDVGALVELAATAEPGGPGFVPAFVGLGAPHWNSDARALFSQISFNTSRAQMARAVTDSIALQVHDVFSAMQHQTGGTMGSLYVDGGPSQNTFLMQCVADLLAHPIIQCAAPEASALGAAYLAGLSLGMWPDLETVARLPRHNTVIRPQAKDNAERLKTWSDAIARSTFEPPPAIGE